jgi:hypothetical protein
MATPLADISKHFVVLDSRRTVSGGFLVGLDSEGDSFQAFARTNEMPQISHLCDQPSQQSLCRQGLAIAQTHHAASPRRMPHDDVMSNSNRAEKRESWGESIFRARTILCSASATISDAKGRNGGFPGACSRCFPRPDDYTAALWMNRHARS